MTKNNIKKSMSPSILVIDDEKAITIILRYAMEKSGMRVYSKTDGIGIIDFIKENAIDAVVLDLMLPDIPGIEICKQIRQCPEISNIPIVVISAQSDEKKRIAALEFGADDYLVKPFSTEELVARIKAVFRRVRPAFSNRKLRFLDIEMDLSNFKVTRNGREVKLANIEFQILQMLMEQTNSVLSRQLIIEKIWGADVYVGPRTVDVHITRLRKALDEYSPTGADVIETVRLAGYSLRSQLLNMSQNMIGSSAESESQINERLEELVRYGNSETPVLEEVTMLQEEDE